MSHDDTDHGHLTEALDGLRRAGVSKPKEYKPPVETIYNDACQIHEKIKRLGERVRQEGGDPAEAQRAMERLVERGVGQS